MCLLVSSLSFTDNGSVVGPWSCGVAPHVFCQGGNWEVKWLIQGPRVKWHKKLGAQSWVWVWLNHLLALQPGEGKWPLQPCFLICTVVKELLKRGSVPSQDLAHCLLCEKGFCQLGLISLPQPLGIVPSLLLHGPQVFQTAGELRPKSQIDRCLESMSGDWRMQSHNRLKL